MTAGVISAFTLEGPCSDGHFDRAYMLEAARAFLDDVAAVADSVPRGVIAFGDDEVTVYGEGKGLSWSEFARVAIDRCKARPDIYGIAFVRPHGDGALLYTAHFEDGQRTVGHGFFFPERRSYKFVPAEAVN